MHGIETTASTTHVKSNVHTAPAIDGGYLCHTGSIDGFGLIGGNFADNIYRSSQHFSNSGGCFGDGPVKDGFYGRFFTPIIFIAFEGDVVIFYPFDKLVRAAANGYLCNNFGSIVFIIVDGVQVNFTGGSEEVIGEPAQDDIDGVFVNNIRCGDFPGVKYETRGVAGPTEFFDSQGAVKNIFNRFSGKMFAIPEIYIIAQL